jgi:hypothetical protein
MTSRSERTGNRGVANRDRLDDGLSRGLSRGKQRGEDNQERDSPGVHV